MKTQISLALVIVAALGIAWFIRSANPPKQGAVSPNRVQSSSANHGTGPSLAVSNDGVTTGKRTSVDTVPVKHRSIPEILAELESELARTDTKSPLIDKPLQELSSLAALGDRQAAAAFAELLGRETGVWFWRGALGGAFSMHPFDSDPVRAAARLAFEAGAPAEGTEFLNIMCSGGKAAESEYLLKLSSDPQDLSSDSIFVQLRRLADHSQAQPWLEKLDGLDEQTGATLASALASWHEPAVDAELWRVAREGSEAKAQTALKALAGEARPQDGRALINALDQFSGRSAVALLSGIASNQDLVHAQAGELRTRALASLESPDPEVAREAARLIAYNEQDLLTADVAISLRALHNEGRLPKDLISPLVHFERQNGSR